MIRFLSEEKAAKMGVEKVELEELSPPRRFHHPARAAKPEADGGHDSVP